MSRVPRHRTAPGRRSSFVAIWAVSGLVAAGCSRDAVTAAPTTLPPDEVGVASWLRTNDAGRPWGERILGSSDAGDGIIKVLTAFNAGDSANALLACQTAHDWWPQSPVAVTELQIVSQAGNVIVADHGDIDGCVT